MYPLPFDACVINWTHLLLALILLLTAHPFKDKAGGEGGGGSFAAGLAMRLGTSYGQF